MSRERVVQDAFLCRVVQLDLKSFNERDAAFQDQCKLLPVHKDEVRERRGLGNNFVPEARYRAAIAPGRSSRAFFSAARSVFLACSSSMTPKSLATALRSSSAFSPAS